MINSTQTLTAVSLLERFSGEWQAATRHAFLEAVADNSLAADAFDAWLVQDYLFVADLVVHQAHMLARAPRTDQAILTSGLVALESELAWFEAHASRRGLSLDVAREPTTARYQGLLEALQVAPYPADLTGLWAIERAYLDAWLGALPGGMAYSEFVEHWTVADFADYVAGLERAADLALRTATAVECARATSAFTDVAQIEREFWEMALPERST
jgi:formylaminopyrimidine deformylase / aminopyrimidine aminohydrolase